VRNYIYLTLPTSPAERQRSSSTYHTSPLIHNGIRSLRTPPRTPGELAVLAASDPRLRSARGSIREEGTVSDRIATGQGPLGAVRCKQSLQWQAGKLPGADMSFAGPPTRPRRASIARDDRERARDPEVD